MIHFSWRLWIRIDLLVFVSTVWLGESRSSPALPFSCTNSLHVKHFIFNKVQRVLQHMKHFAKLNFVATGHNLILVIASVVCLARDDTLSLSRARIEFGLQSDNFLVNGRQIAGAHFIFSLNQGRLPFRNSCWLFGWVLHINQKIVWEFLSRSW